MNRRKLFFVFLGFLLLIEFGVLVWQFSGDSEPVVSLDPKGPGEKLTEIRAEITIHKDGHLSVKEFLEFRAELNKIKKGLYRSLPTSIEAEEGVKKNLQYQLKSSSFEGKPIEAKTRQTDKFFFIELRQEEPPLTEGIHSFEVEYEIQGAIEKLPDYDRLSYYVTGSWSLPILKASALVFLPQYLQANLVITKGFTGNREKKGQDFLRDAPKEDILRFWTTQPLLNGDEFQFEIRMPGGFIQESK